MIVNTGFLLVLAFLGLVAIGAPVYVALIAPALVYVLMNDTTLGLVATEMTRTLDSFTILAVPLFIYVGSLMNECGITDRIFKFTNDAVGHHDGGTAQVNVVTSLVFSGISGSALADVGGIGQILIKRMSEEGYDEGYSAALTSVSATIGPIFPPSIPLIMFGVLAQVSVLDLLLAGIGPAILLSVLLMVAVWVHARVAGFPTQVKASRSKVGRSFLLAVPALLTPVLLIAGMLSGVFGPTAAAGVTVLWVIIISVLAYREYSNILSYIWSAGLETSKLTANVLLIVAGASLFNWVLTIERTAQAVGDFMLTFSSEPILLLLIVNVFLLILGLFLEPLSALVISIPLVVPLLIDLGLNPIHIGVIMVFNLMIGLVTPPLGLTLFITSDISEEPIENIISEMRPYYLVLLVALLVITFVPELSLWIPNQSG